MIRSFGDRPTADIYHGKGTRYARKFPQEIHGKICRVLDQMNAAPSLEVLRSPPGNRLERPKGDLKEFWSLRINDQWRVVFKWDSGDAHEVRITDYH